jgi:hypothetical protein
VNRRIARPPRARERQKDSMPWPESQAKVRDTTGSYPIKQDITRTIDCCFPVRIRYVQLQILKSAIDPFGV